MPSGECSEIARHVGESTMLICRKSDALRPIRREPNGRLRGWLVARHEHRTGCNFGRQIQRRLSGREAFETVIGLEVHAQLLTQSKMYCGCSARYADAPPNTFLVCIVCGGFPGALPVLNKAALEAAS